MQFIGKFAAASLVLLGTGNLGVSASPLNEDKSTITDTNIEISSSVASTDINNISVNSTSEVKSSTESVENPQDLDLASQGSNNKSESVNAPDSTLPSEEVANSNLKTRVFDPRIKFQLFAIDTTSINTYWGSTNANTFNRDYSQLYNQYTIVPVASISFFSSRQDELRIMGILSNYQFNSPGCGTPNAGTAHFYCYPTQNSLNLFRAWYSFKFNDNFKVIGGPRMYSYDLLPVSTAAYSPKGATYIGLRSLLFDIVDFASVPGTYPLTIGPGGGITFSKNGWALGGGVIAGNPQTGDITGMLDNNAGSTGVVQLSYTGKRGGFQAAWTNTDYYNGQIYFQQGSGSPAATWHPFNFATPMNVKTGAIGGYYYIIPDRFSISGGMNYGFYTATSSNLGAGIVNGDTAVGNSWLLTLQYEKAFRDDITIGTSFGQLGMLKSNTSQGAMDNQSTTPWMILGFLNWQVAKELSVSPFIYWSTSSSSTSFGQTTPATASFGGALMVTLSLY
jgi:hypothetical protein